MCIFNLYKLMTDSPTHVTLVPRCHHKLPTGLWETLHLFKNQIIITSSFNTDLICLNVVNYSNY